MVGDPRFTDNLLGANTDDEFAKELSAWLEEVIEEPTERAVSNV